MFPARGLGAFSVAVLAAVCFFALCGSGEAAITIDGVAVSPASAPRYAKVELTVALSGEAATEFYESDPARGGLDLSATFTSPSNATWAVNGFYNGDAWLIRFAPDETGTWGYSVVATDPSGTSNTVTGTFTCVASSHRGWARIDGHFLRFSTGQVAFAVGHNTGWQDGPEGVEVPTLAEMASRGENLLSFWLATPWDLPSWGPERAARSPIENSEGGLGNYNQAACAYLDGVVARAEAAGVCLLPTIWSHGQLRDDGHPWGEGWWANNAYNEVCSATAFFDTNGTEQWRLQRNFYRYLIARWGYSRAVAGWVGLCEADGTTGFVSNRAQVEAWCSQVQAYFAANDPFRTNGGGKFPIAFTKLNDATWKTGFDVRATDSYSSQTDDTGVANTLATQTRTMWGSGQPCFHAEFGGYMPGGASQPTHLHNGTWGGTSAGAALTPLVWCDDGSFPMLTADMQNHLEDLSQFMAGISYLGDPALAPASISFSGASTYRKYHRGWGMRIADRGYVWIQNTYRDVGNTTLNVSGLAPGDYTVEWYNVWASGATPVQTNVIACSGTLSAAIPSIGKRDVAVRFQIVGANAPPVADGQQVATDEDTALAITLTATDPDGDPLTFAIASGPANGALSGTPPNVVYTPAADYNGSDSFTFKANDSQADSNVATVAITVGPVNDPPVAADDNTETEQDTPVVISVLANDTDTDGDTLTVSNLGTPSDGEVALNPDGTVTYTPDPGFIGSDSFNYTANDGHGGFDVALVHITVTRVNHPPVADDQAVQTDEDTAVGIVLTASDPDNNPLTYAIVAGPAHGALTGVAPDLTYTPAANYHGDDGFTFKANDGKADSNIATVAITVNPVNDAPTAAADAYSVDQDGTLALAAPGVLANDSDVDGDALTAVLATGPAHGQLTLNAGGSFTYTPTAGYSGTDSFTYTASDGSAQSDPATVTITVNPSTPTAAVSIDLSVASVSKWWRATAVVTVKDPSGAAIVGATAGAHWTGTYSASVSGTTDAEGRVTFASALLKKAGTITFTVDHVTVGGQDCPLTGQTSASKTY